ncbi:MAG: glycosyltransferase family 4 protein [Rhizomicrobium sp.]
MKILIANMAQSRGGAARAMQRIAGALRDAGAQVQLAAMEVQDDGALRVPSLPSRVEGALDRLPVLGYRNGPALFRSLNFSPGWRKGDAAPFLNTLDADVINLHWVNYGLLSPEGVASLGAPVVWTMHDMWPFTGGCHYAGDCTRYRSGCGTCPVLRSDRPDDLSSRLWRRKAEAWRDKRYSIVSPSNWLADCARAEGGLFSRMPISVIANPIDIARFAPGDRAAARRKFGLPADAPIILFGGYHAVQNRLKGFAHLQAALRLTQRKAAGPTPHLVIFGSGEEARPLVGLDMPVHLLGLLHSEADIADAYRAADVFVLPSSQDNLPNTIAESLSCGTPVCAFRIGGVPDMVREGVTGFLAEPFDAADLARAIGACIEASRSGPAFRDAARHSAEALFDASKIAQAYLAVFRAAISRQSTPGKA